MMQVVPCNAGNARQPLDENGGPQATSDIESCAAARQGALGLYDAGISCMMHRISCMMHRFMYDAQKIASAIRFHMSDELDASLLMI